jgi:hypothetical protein
VLVQTLMFGPDPVRPENDARQSRKGRSAHDMKGATKLGPRPRSAPASLRRLQYAGTVDDSCSVPKGRPPIFLPVCGCPRQPWPPAPPRQSRPAGGQWPKNQDLAATAAFSAAAPHETKVANWRK